MSGYDPDQDRARVIDLAMAALDAELGASDDTYDLSTLDPDLQAELDAAEAELAAAGIALDSLPLDQPLPDLAAAEALRQAEDAEGMPWDTEARTAYLLSRVERGTYIPPAPAGEDASGCGARDDLGYCTARYHDAGCLSVLSAEAANGSAESALAWRAQLLSNHGAASALQLANERLDAQDAAQAASGVRSSAAYREMRGLLGLGSAVAINRYVLTATVTVPPGAFTLGGNGFGTGSYAQGAGEYGSAASTTWVKGTVIEADPAGALFTAIGSGNLAAYRDGTDAVGHAAVEQLMPGLPDYDGQPSIDELTGRDDGPERGPGELSARMRAFMGEADAPPRERDPAAPDTAALRDKLGL